MKNLLFILLILIPFFGIGQIDMLNRNLILERFPNALAVELDVDGLDASDANYSGVSTNLVHYFEGSLFESNGVFVNYFLDENGNFDSPKEIRFVWYDISSERFVYGTTITYYRNGKIKEVYQTP